VWFNDEVYFVKLEALKKINKSDVVIIPTGEIVTWHKGKKEWVKCAEGSLKFKKYTKL
jgi:hypothetical protein